MKSIKLQYMMNGTNYEETYECALFDLPSIASAMEKKVLSDTGEPVQIRLVSSQWCTGDVLLFSMNCESSVMSGYAYEVPSNSKKYVYGIWLNGAEHESTDPDELYETDVADESAAASFFVQAMDLNVTDTEKAVMRIISVQ